MHIPFLRLATWSAVAATLFCWNMAVAGAPAQSVQVSEAWARATAPNTSVGAAFMTLRASKDDRLLGASTAVAQRVEVHSMVEQDGRMQMRPLQSLQLPRGKAVELSPTGTHLMLIGLRESLRAEKHFEITLRFEQAGEQTVKVHVKSPADVSKSHEGHPSHH